MALPKIGFRRSYKSSGRIKPLCKGAFTNPAGQGGLLKKKKSKIPLNFNVSQVHL